MYVSRYVRGVTFLNERYTEGAKHGIEKGKEWWSFVLSISI